MNLRDFLPYRLSVTADATSRALAQVYAERFALTRDEWRVIAQLADAKALKASELGRRTSLPKMQVSRALMRLEGDGLVRREPDVEDRRNLVVALTATGRALYRKVEPVVLEREAFLLATLGADEREAFLAALAKIEERALQLSESA